MRKRFAVSLAMLASGATLLASASFASQHGSTARKGGILRFTLAFGIENIDPQRSFYSPEWQYEWLTGRMLLTFAHRKGALGYRLVKDGASGYTVSRDGRTYTFRIRPGMKLSDGSRLAAANYKHALLRILHPDVDSSLASLFTDPATVNIVGASDYIAGRTSTVPGIRTRGPHTLIIELVSPSPLLATLMALPPTGGVSRRLPFSAITSVNASNPLPTGGRYYVQEYVRDRRLRIRKNRFYKALGAVPIPGVAAGFDYEIGVQQDQALLLIKSTRMGCWPCVDWAVDGLPPGAWDALFDQYGTKGRARLFPTAVVDYITLNNSKGPFADVNARKAIAWGIDRSRIASVFGRYARTPQCSLLTPAVPGYKRCTVYPNTPDLARARSLASGHLHDRINYWYTSSTSGPQIQQLVTAQLRAIGFDNIEHRPFSSGVFTALGRRGNSYDLAVVGWAALFADPYAYVNTLLSGDTIRDVLNTNTAYFNDPEANRLMRAAARLTGRKRLETYGKLDLLIQERWAPIVILGHRNDRAFFSVRIDTKSIFQSPVYGLDLGRLALR
jgi:peptide/nickel transport system substrate-binding protein